MAGRGTGPGFRRGPRAGPRRPDRASTTGTARMSLTEVAAATGLARPTARRLLLTLDELGYVRLDEGAFALTPKVLRLGMAYVGSLGLWDVARPHLEDLVGQTGESSSMAQLDGSDIVYVARVSVPKIIALRVVIGTRFPALQTSQGKVLLAALDADALTATLAEPSRSGLPPFRPRDPATSHRRRAAHGPRPRLGPGRRGTRARDPVGGRAGPRRRRRGARGHERDRARRRDERRHAGRRPPAAAAARGGGRLGGLGAVAVAAARRGAPRAPQVGVPPSSAVI